MNGQLVFDGDPAPGTIEHAFLVFHRANPWVYHELVRLTRELVAVGHHKVGIGMLFEVLRWEHHRRTADPGSEFKLNNNYRSRYARLIMDAECDLRGVYEIRELKAA